MDANKIKEIQNMIKNHQITVHPPSRAREVPVGRPVDEDISKVMTNDIIGKGGDSDLRK